MKPTGLRTTFLLALIMLSFTSCKEEEFYEKEYIESLSEKYEQENLPDEIAEIAWEDPENNPDQEDYDPEKTPDASDSVNDDGVADGSDLGSNDDSVADGSNSGSSDDSTSGGSDSGSNDDSASGGSDSGSSDDSVADGSDSGSSDDSASGGSDSGSNDDSVADGSDSNSDDDPASGGSDSGSNDDSVADGSDSTPEEEPVYLIDQRDSFQVQGTGNKIDVLWVVDNSGSMGDEQRALGENFNAFIKEFVEQDIDFKMAVTTTDVSRNNAGREYKDSMTRLTYAKMQEDKDKFMRDFAEMVKVGTRGSGYEKGLRASEVFADRYANSWMRDDAYFIVVYVSDEEDQSPKTVEGHLKQIQKWKKQNKNLIKAYSIVDMVETRRKGAVLRGYARYNEMSELTGGKVASIKGNFYDTLLDMGGNIASLKNKYPLTNTPHSSDSISVFVNGELNVHWSYDSDSNSIVFGEDANLTANSLIQVDYDVEQVQ